MEKFLEMIALGLESEDEIVRHFTYFQTRDFPNMPISLINRQLENALEEIDHENYSALINCAGAIDETSIPLLVKILEKLPANRKHMAMRLVNELPIEQFVQHAHHFKEELRLGEVEFYEAMLKTTPEQLKQELSLYLEEMEEQEAYNSYMYTKVKKMQERLIHLQGYDEQEVIDCIQRQLSEDFFTYEGIFAVRAVGILKIASEMETLASLLQRDEDVLLEEVHEALIAFQSDDVVCAVEPYIYKEESYISALTIIKEIKTPLAEKVLLQAYPHLDEDGKELVIEGLASLFSEETFSLIEDYIEHDYWGQMIDTEEAFYGFHRLMDRPHPLMEEWKKVYKEHQLHLKEMSDMSFEDLMKMNIQKQTPITVEKTGRNDPCPCGSGKKYKKCCGKN